jgi:hypothetical protein
VSAHGRVGKSTLARASPDDRRRSAGMRTLGWVLGEATAVSSEITAVRLRDPDDPRAPAPSQVSRPALKSHTGQPVGARPL